MVTECRMRRNRSFAFLSSSSSPLQTSSSPSSTAVAVVAPPTNNKQHLHDHCPSVMDSAFPINTRSKAGSNIILLLTITAIFPAFYAMGILIGTTISTYTPWDGDITSMSMPSTMTLRKQITDENLIIDTVGMSRNEHALLKSLSSSPFLRGKVLDMMVQEYIAPTTLDNDNESKRESAIEAWQFTEAEDEPIPIQGYPYLFVGSVGTHTMHAHAFKNGVVFVDSLHIMSSRILRISIHSKHFAFHNTSGINESPILTKEWNHTYHQLVLLGQMQFFHRNSLSMLQRHSVTHRNGTTRG